MSKTLDVYLHRYLVGHLTQDEYGLMAFEYAKDWLEKTNVVPLSHSLPLREERFSYKECRGFFAGILPESNNRDLIARNLGISPRNDFAMLEKIGGECAGAVTFMPVGQPLPKYDERYRQLSDQELVDTLKALPRRPLLAGDEGVRLSLAGAQDKIAVRLASGQVSIPLGSAPSTHIIKPAIEHFSGLVFNEALCMKLASSVGLPVAKVEARTAMDIDYLLVERYDRKGLERLHQEDFCQALGVAPEMKYQNEGGPSLKQCFELLREVSSAPVVDLQYLLDAVIFNFLIGNHDAHGKNFSLLYIGSDARLAPFYDMISTVYYPNLAKKMAMKIGGEYASENISPRNFEKLADETGLAKPIVKRRVPELAAAVLASLKNMPIEHSVAKDIIQLIRRRCETIQGERWSEAVKS